MTTMPQPADPTQSYTATYDAWNRLVKLEQPATPSPETVAAYAYDGAKRRIMQQSYISGTLSETRHLYYTQPSQWQVIEERIGTSPDSADAERQFVWGLRYIDDCVLRDRDTNANGTLDERLYAMQDANWNVTGIADDTGSIQERYAYSAYGMPVCLSAAFVPQSAAFDWESLYCGYRYEASTGLFHVRNRVYLPTFGMWVQRDTVKYLDSTNLYQYCISLPLATSDPTGKYSVVFAALPAILVAIADICGIGAIAGIIAELFLGGGVNLGTAVCSAITGCVFTLCTVGLWSLLFGLAPVLEHFIVIPLILTPIACAYAALDVCQSCERTLGVNCSVC